jgi:PKD repeat protein
LFEKAGVFDVALWARGPGGIDALHRQRAVVAKGAAPIAADFTVAPVLGLAPLKSVFSDRSTGAISSWSWDFGDGARSNQRNPEHVYERSGDYTVSLTVTGGMESPAAMPKAPGRALDGLLMVQSSRSDLIHVLEPPPVAGFEAEPTRGFHPLTVAFRDTSTPNVTDWEWDFGDGARSAEREPRHTYATAGLFDVTLSVTGPGGKSSVKRAGLVEVRWSLTADFDVSPPGGIAPLTVYFLDRSVGGPTSWLWSFGDGATARLRNPSHFFPEAGTYPVELTVGRQGESDSLTIPVEIREPRPDARFTVSSTAGEVPLGVYFLDRSIGNVTAWEWDFGDGRGSFERNPFHAYLAPGVYTVRFRVWGPGGLDGVVRRDAIRVTNPLHRFLQLGGVTGPLPSVGQPKPRF